MCDKINKGAVSALYQSMGISAPVYHFGAEILEGLSERFAAIDEVAEYNQLKVLKAMQKNQVSEACLLGTTGYGYNDMGRDTLEAVYADVFHTEDALVRPQITCGTHALALALMSNLRPGDELLSPVGKPYDTLEEVIGKVEARAAAMSGSLQMNQDTWYADKPDITEDNVAFFIKYLKHRKSTLDRAWD